MKRLTKESEKEIRDLKFGYPVRELLSEIDALRSDVKAEQLASGMLNNENTALAKECEALRNSIEETRSEACATLIGQEHRLGILNDNLVFAVRGLEALHRATLDANAQLRERIANLRSALTEITVDIECTLARHALAEDNNYQMESE